MAIRKDQPPPDRHYFKQQARERFCRLRCLDDRASAA
jgi:hypothetical protein